MSSFITYQDVHIDVPLTNLTIARVQDFTGFVADKVFPLVPVQKATDKYYVWNSGDFLRADDVKPRAPRTEPEEFGLSFTTDTYSIEQYADAFSVDFETYANEDAALDVKLAHSTAAIQKHMIAREQRWSNTFFTSGVWDTDWTGVANAANDTAIEFTKFSDYTNSDPIVEIRRAIRAAKVASYNTFRPAKMVMTADVLDTLLDHPKILSRINGGASVGDPAMVNLSLMAQAFGVSEILVNEAMVNTAKEGLADNVGYVNSGKIAIFHEPPAPSKMVAAPGYIFTWSGVPNSSYGIDIVSYRDDALARQGVAERCHAIVNEDMKLVSPSLGIMLNSVL